MDAFGGLLLQVLLKASQDKRYVCEVADRALGSVIDSMTPLPFLQKLRAHHIKRKTKHTLNDRLLEARDAKHEVFQLQCMGTYGG
ncbi:hypothetical protein E2542_SST18561 [Spatholobus suberectus]|nr:hypothetical protein E2542_SST18561 [Spatholobus suberectus]